MAASYLHNAGPAPSRAELLQRLHEKIEAARLQRHAEEEAGGGGKKQTGGKEATSPGDQAKAWRQQQLEKQVKQQQAGAKRCVGSGQGHGSVGAPGVRHHK
jgi:hypothetical protein